MQKRKGKTNPQQICSHTCNADGTCIMACFEYRGAGYEYDFETEPKGTTFLVFYSAAEFGANGDVIDQYIEELE